MLLAAQVQERVLLFRADVARFQDEAAQLDRLRQTLVELSDPDAKPALLVPLGPRCFLANGAPTNRDRVTVQLGNGVLAHVDVAQALDLLEHRVELVEQNLVKAREAERAAVSELQLIDEQLAEEDHVVDIREVDEEEAK